MLQLSKIQRAIKFAVKTHDEYQQQIEEIKKPVCADAASRRLVHALAHEQSESSRRR
jgi:hypothetical protein